MIIITNSFQINLSILETNARIFFKLKANRTLCNKLTLSYVQYVQFRVTSIVYNN